MDNRMRTMRPDSPRNIPDADRMAHQAALDAAAWKAAISAAADTPIIIAGATGEVATYINGTYEFVPGEVNPGDPPVFLRTHQRDGHSSWLFFTTNRRWAIGNAPAMDYRAAVPTEDLAEQLEQELERASSNVDVEESSGEDATVTVGEDVAGEAATEQAEALAAEMAARERLEHVLVRYEDDTRRTRDARWRDAIATAETELATATTRLEAAREWVAAAAPLGAEVDIEVEEETKASDSAPSRPEETSIEVQVEEPGITPARVATFRVPEGQTMLGALLSGSELTQEAPSSHAGLLPSGLAEAFDNDEAIVWAVTEQTAIAGTLPPETGVFATGGAWITDGGGPWAVRTGTTFVGSSTMIAVTSDTAALWWLTSEMAEERNVGAGAVVNIEGATGWLRNVINGLYTVPARYLNLQRGPRWWPIYSRDEQIWLYFDPENSCWNIGLSEEEMINGALGSVARTDSVRPGTLPPQAGLWSVLLRADRPRKYKRQMSIEVTFLPESQAAPHMQTNWRIGDTGRITRKQLDKLRSLLFCPPSEVYDSTSGQCVAKERQPKVLESYGYWCRTFDYYEISSQLAELFSLGKNDPVVTSLIGQEQTARLAEIKKQWFHLYVQPARLRTVTFDERDLPKFCKIVLTEQEGETQVEASVEEQELERKLEEIGANLTAIRKLNLNNKTERGRTRSASYKLREMGAKRDRRTLLFISNYATNDQFPNDATTYRFRHYGNY